MGSKRQTADTQRQSAAARADGANRAGWLFYQMSNLTGSDPAPPFLAASPVSFLKITVQSLYADGSMETVTLEDPITGARTNRLDPDTLFLSSAPFPARHAQRGELVAARVYGQFSSRSLRIHRDGSKGGDRLRIHKEFEASLEGLDSKHSTLILAITEMGDCYPVGSFSCVEAGDYSA